MFRGKRSGITRFRVFKIFSQFSVITLILLMCSQMVYGGLAPDFTLTDIDGNTFSLSDFRGKVVIIEFFATWCGSCVNQVPHLKVVKNEFGVRLVMISLSWTDTNEELRQFRDDYGISWIVARDTANVKQKYNVTLKPTLYIIDQEGYTRYHHIDVVVEASILIEEVNGLLSAIEGDVDGDGDVDRDDFIEVAAAYGSSSGQAAYDERADFDHDGDVDYDDFIILAGNYGENP